MDLNDSRHQLINMKIFLGIIVLTSLIGMSISCNIFTPTPEVPQVVVSETAVPTPLPPSPLPPTATSAAVPERIIYYYFVPVEEAAYPEGSVVIMPDTYILAPVLSESAYDPDTATDLRTALAAMLRDERNGWTSTNLEIVEVTFNVGHAGVVLQGEYFGVGSVTLIAARMQILLTIFANPAVQTATVTLNGDTIGNLGISHSLEAKPTDYVFTRSEIEVYAAENMYVLP